MNCERCREAWSAGLDGEATASELAAASGHLATCAPCRAVVADMETLHRIVRVVPAEPVPDLSRAILGRQREAATPDIALWRVGLVAVAVAQLAAAVVHLGGDHLARDQAAWEAALASGFAWAAWRPARAVGLLPVTAVLAVLLLANGGLGLGGAGSHHLLAPLGLVLLTLAVRPFTWTARPA